MLDVEWSTLAAGVASLAAIALPVILAVLQALAKRSIELKFDSGLHLRISAKNIRPEDVKVYLDTLGYAVPGRELDDADEVEDDSLKKGGSDGEASA